MRRRSDWERWSATKPAPSRRRTLARYTVRLHRLHPKKTKVHIFDLVDREVPMHLRMFERRVRGYRALGYVRGEAAIDDAETVREPTVVYEEEAIKDVDEIS